MYCGKCGATVRDGAKFCPSCGASLAGAPDPIPGGDQPVSPVDSPYTPPTTPPYTPPVAPPTTPTKQRVSGVLPVRLLSAAAGLAMAAGAVLYLVTCVGGATVMMNIFTGYESLAAAAGMLGYLLWGTLVVLVAALAAWRLLRFAVGPGPEPAGPGEAPRYKVPLGALLLTILFLLLNVIVWVGALVVGAAGIKSGVPLTIVLKIADAYEDAALVGTIGAAVVLFAEVAARNIRIGA